MTDTPEDIRATAQERADRWVHRGHHDNASLAADFAEAITEERNRPDKPATTVFGNLLWHHLQAARADFNGPERQRISALIDAFQAQYPDECKVWEDRYPGTPEGQHG